MRCELVDASPSGRQRAGLHDGEHPSSENYLAFGEVFACLLLGKSSFSYHFKTYGPRRYTTASIPMTTSATKIRVPATTLPPVSR
jgi:hypothetical protein